MAGTAKPPGAALSIEEEYAENLRRAHFLSHLKTQASYRSGLRAAVRGLWSGVVDLSEFWMAMAQAIEFHFHRAWYEGMAQVGLSPEDITPEEQFALNQMILDEMQFITGFGLDIEAGSKANGGKLEPQFERVELWIKRYTNVTNQALQRAKNDPVLEWVTHATESCTSCIKLNGQRRRASTWARLDLRPQHPNRLECMRSAGGVDVCKCTFNPTNQPPTRGRLPKV